jgi:hypothetical protein
METMNVRKTLAALLLLLVSAAPAHADATAFWGFSPQPATRPAAGFAIGLSLIIVGFEFEYSGTSEDLVDAAPSLRTGMFNGLIQTPTRTQLYFTAGGGVFRERLNEVSETHFGTNIGGGVKLGLVGPLRLRVDYRLFNLRGSPIDKRPQRLYAGANITF